MNFNKFKNGSIIKVFLNKFILVKTSDGSILIEKYYPQIKLKQNQIFRDINFAADGYPLFFKPLFDERWSKVMVN